MASRGEEWLLTPPTHTYATNDKKCNFRFVENAFLHRSLIVKSQQNRLELVMTDLEVATAN